MYDYKVGDLISFDIGRENIYKILKLRDPGYADLELVKDMEWKPGVVYPDINIRGTKLYKKNKQKKFL